MKDGFSKRCGRALSGLLALLAAGSAWAQAPALPLPSNRVGRPAPPDPRCAADGPGFVYSKATGSCVRIGGAVSVGIGGGSGSPPWRR